MRCLTMVMLCSLALSAGLAKGAERLDLVKNGQAVAVILYGREDQIAAARLSRRVKEWTGASLATVDAERGGLDIDTKTAVLIGSPASNPAVREALGGDERVRMLGDEGLLIKTTRWQGKPTAVLTGRTRLGAIFATGDFLNWHLVIDGANAWVESADIIAIPAMSKRLVWTSLAACNWAPEYAEFNAKEAGGTYGASSMSGQEGYLKHAARMVDFLAEHKFNGAIFYGFVSSTTGGIEAAQKMSRHARRNGIRILPLIGTMFYNGFTMSPDLPFNLGKWST